MRRAGRPRRGGKKAAILYGFPGSSRLPAGAVRKEGAETLVAFLEKYQAEHA